ncbi:MAG: hypothetical protein ACF8SC_12970 [Phycisphaerales bacterium JB037]
MKIPVLKTVAVSALALLALTASIVAVRFVRSDAAASVYRERLAALQADYQGLVEQFNQAVRRTAVSELVVTADAVTVRVRTSTGVERIIETPFAPDDVIYVDCLVLDGRLWMRRLYNETTAPANGIVIDPAIADIAWDESREPLGKAVYRQFGEGRWVASISGSGSLMLARAEGPVELATLPEVRDYSEIVSEADAAVREVSFGEAMRHAFGLD